MGRLIRTISSDGSVIALAVDGTDFVERARQIHGTVPVTTAALGRLLCAASLMGSMLKGKDDSLTLRVSGDGPAGAVIAVSDSNGCPRGYVMNPVISVPPKYKGKLDVGVAIGKGTLTVLKDMGMEEPYSAQVALVSGEIAEDITGYYAVSEQTPTVCALGVLVGGDSKVICAGGLLIQLLPGADDEVIDKIEKGLEGFPALTSLMSQGMTLEKIIKKALPDFSMDILDESHPEYICPCSRSRAERILISTGKEELEDMAKDEFTEVTCQFCDKKYKFTSLEILKLIKSV